MADDKKKYKAMEPVLQNINKHFVSLAENHIKRNNIFLKEFIDLIINKMKEKDNLFKEMYTRVFFGGSFYDGLRVGQPDEFDLDLLLSLPRLVGPTITTSDIPGYVHLQFKDYKTFMKQIDIFVRYKGLIELIDENNFLDTSKVLKWMESVVNLALNDFQKKGNEYILNALDYIFYAKVRKSGPAFTLEVYGDVGGEPVHLDIDLVPCFVFGKDKWPVDGFRKNPITKKPQFFIVPKPLKGVSNSNHYWRLSFQEQEREIIDGKDTLKPTVKLLKKMRDNLDHKCIASYYLKTVILWETFEKRDEKFWNSPLSYVFMNVLKEYYNCLNNGEIKYFWNADNNLIKNIKKITITNLSNRVKAIMDDVEKHTEDPYVITKYLLSKSELVKLDEEMPYDLCAGKK